MALTREVKLQVKNTIIRTAKICSFSYCYRNLTPPPSPTSELFQTTLPLVIYLISLRTIDGVHMYPLGIYVGNNNKKRALQREKLIFISFFVSGEVEGIGWDGIIWAPSIVRKNNYKINFYPPTIILQSGSLRESLTIFSENHIIDIIKWNYQTWRFYFYLFQFQSLVHTHSTKRCISQRYCILVLLNILYLEGTKCRFYSEYVVCRLAGLQSRLSPGQRLVWYRVRTS